GPLDDLLADRGEHDAPRVALDELHAQLLLQLLDLGGERGLAHEAGLGGPSEVAVVGHRHQVAQVSQVHGGPPRSGAGGDGLGRAAGAARPVSRQALTSASSSAGAEVRMRWSKALSAAVAPAPMATTICLYGTVVASPAANTPGTDVWPRSSMTISPRGLSSTVPCSHSVLGRRPIWTNTPSRAS